MSLYTYSALVERVLDGDTLIASIDLGFHTWRQHERVRLAHLNAAELKTPAGVAAWDFVVALLGPLPAPVTVQTLKDRQEKYGRYLVVITTESGINVNEALVAAGHAVPYEG